MLVSAPQLPSSHGLAAPSTSSSAGELPGHVPVGAAGASAWPTAGENRAPAPSPAVAAADVTSASSGGGRGPGRSDRPTALRPGGERVYTCDQCEYTTPTVRLIIAHERVHSDERPFPCSFCSYRAKRAFEIKARVRSLLRE